MMLVSSSGRAWNESLSFSFRHVRGTEGRFGMDYVALGYMRYNPM